MTKSLTKTQQIKNCLLALVNWKTVSPRSVDLGIWRCGTQACFGGHLARWPEFQAQGVRPAPDSSPMMKPGICTRFDDAEAHDVATHLFGNCSMFDHRNVETDGPDGGYNSGVGDHQIVVRRLENQIVELSTRKAQRE